MICHLCKQKVFKVRIIVKGVKIYECSDCQLAFIDQNLNNTHDARPNNIGEELYNFRDYQSQEEKLRKNFTGLTDTIIKFKKKGKVLDVGAGFGLFASILEKKGNFNVDLIEPVNRLRFIDKSKQRIFKVPFEKFTGKNNAYDLVVMLDVLEHFKNPKIALKKAFKLLKNDGFLLIQTPNYQSLMARICRDWAWWMVEDHKFFFSVKSLNKILKQTGFKSVQSETYENWYDFRKNLDGNFRGIKNKLIRKGIKAIFFSLFVPFYFLLRRTIWKLNYGGLIYEIAEKKN